MTFYISRYKNMGSVEFEVEVVTPMFLGGANTTADWVQNQETGLGHFV